MDIQNNTKGVGPVIALTFVWLGLLIGISFLEAPLKFQAPGVTREIGLSIGIVVFGALNKVELLLGTLIFVLLIRAKPSRVLWIVYSIIFAFLLTQTFWLTPELVIRAKAIIAGETVPPSPLHGITIVLEGLKIIALITAGTMSLKLLKQRERLSS